MSNAQLAEAKKKKDDLQAMWTVVDTTGSVTVTMGPGPAPAEALPVEWKVKELSDLLNRLENLGSADAIADYFRAEGVRGQRGNASDCPMQKWFQVETDVNYRVSGSGVSKNGVMVATLPKAARDFIRAFDHGVYRDLSTNNNKPGIAQFDLYVENGMAPSVAQMFPGAAW